MFDRDPGWPGVNNRSAREREPATIRQDFGYSIDPTIDDELYAVDPVPPDDEAPT